MKLDENVCRGSLISHRGESLVVVGLGVHVQARDGRWGYEITQHFGWRVMSVDQIENGGVIDALRTLDKEQEVEMFFPGEVYALPDYIR